MEGAKLTPGVGIIAAGLAAAIFVVDSNAALNASVAIIYICVLGLVGLRGARRDILIATSGCAALSILAWGLVHGGTSDLPSILRLGFVLVALALTAALLINRLKLQAMRLELEDSRTELTTFADSVPQLLWRSTPDGRWDFLNRRFTEITGVEREEGIARQTWRECVHPDDMGPLREKLIRSLETGEDVSHQVRLRHKDGSYRWMSMARRAVRSPQTGEILRFYGGSTDIHEEVLAQQKIHELMAQLEQRVEERTEELTRTEARYTSLFDVGNISFAEMDFRATKPILDQLRDEGVTDLRAHMNAHPDLFQHCLGLIKTTRVNEALARLMGYENLAELAANPPAENAEDGPEVLLRQLEMAFYGSEYIDGRTVLIGKDGQRITVFFTVIRLESGLHLSSHLNLTEQEGIAELRRAAQDELARANRIATIGAYSATIAHELNQPISSITMDVQTTLRWLRSDQPDLASAIRGLERLTRTVERVRTIVQRTRESVTAHRRKVSEFDLCALVTETCDLLDGEVRRAGATLELQCDSDFPPIEADPIELQQVLVNLTTNAAEAMIATPGSRRIVVSVRNMGGGVSVSVADTGPGIPQDQLTRLFEPFFTTKATGMGMGLQVCRNAVESMGGTLNVHNREEGGAIFAFILPAAEAIQTAA
ncbi:PAS domain S-box protein [Sphingomonas populi]|uniref:histidine kinase n=1 Tax=Sphingomonas populi TaxID=2484750 RepID=A0A4Q6Y3G0_9SPHN|nr:ATP-binding protein [Sphingomonas populi]RZF63847.1 PAS domain S-box protein [Sphingomonas populi]